MSSVDTVVDEWAAFNARNPDVAKHGWGGLLWGFMRAIAECPACGPGVYRHPVDGNSWDLLACPKCGGVWRWSPPEEAGSKARKRRRS